MGKGLAVVISGPSGVGKTTITRALLERNKDFCYSVSYTTRRRRAGEVDGKDYFFVTEKEFKEKIRRNYFFEYAIVHNNYYGTPKNFLLENIKKGKVVILDIDIQGGLNVKKHLKDNSVLIYLSPPKFSTLKQRLLKRNLDGEEEILQRLQHAKYELTFKNKYDYCVVNDDIEKVCKKIENIIYKRKGAR
jgi:guanylate kinase